MSDKVILAKLDGLRDLVQEKFKQNEKEHKGLKGGLDKKASIWVETITKGMVGTILLTVIGALMALIIIPSAFAVAYNLITIV